MKFNNLLFLCINKNFVFINLFEMWILCKKFKSALDFFLNEHEIFRKILFSYLQNLSSELDKKTMRFADFAAIQGKLCDVDFPSCR